MCDLKIPNKDTKVDQAIMCNLRMAAQDKEVGKGGWTHNLWKLGDP